MKQLKGKEYFGCVIVFLLMQFERLNRLKDFIIAHNEVSNFMQQGLFYLTEGLKRVLCSESHPSQVPVCKSSKIRLRCFIRLCLWSCDSRTATSYACSCHEPHVMSEGHGHVIHFVRNETHCTIRTVFSLRSEANSLKVLKVQHRTYIVLNLMYTSKFMYDTR